MELALNLIWLGVSTLLLLAGIAHVARGADDRCPTFAAIALVCLVCLLFPVISMTDDLNSGGPAIIEPGKLKNVVQSAPVVLALLSRSALQAPPEGGWLTRDRQPDLLIPNQEIFSFDLSRRPPPQTPSV